MGQDLSIEYPDKVVLITIRTIASRLWFVNNEKLIERVLAYLAKYQEQYGVLIYAFVIVGNHIHLLLRFPNANRAAFLRAFNSIFAKLTARYVPGFIDGKLWARRARVQVVPNPPDVLYRFGYVVLNPISHHLCKRLSEHNGYSSLHDSLRSTAKKYSIIDWADYQNRKRTNTKLTPNDCKKEYSLTFSRLPAFEKLSHKEYRSKMLRLMEARRQTIIKEAEEKGAKFGTAAALKRTRPGDLPRTTKTSTRHSKRPLVLTLCAETRATFLNSYFKLLEMFRIASRKFRAGHFRVAFPPGTNRPHCPVPI